MPAPSAAPTVAVPARTRGIRRPGQPGRPRSPPRTRRPVAIAPGRVRRAASSTVWIAGALLAVIVLVGLFFAAGNSSAAPPRPPWPVQRDAATDRHADPHGRPGATGPQPAGVHKWDTLFGGECLQPYASPWDEEFTVADCAAPHAAQLVYRRPRGRPPPRSPTRNPRPRESTCSAPQPA